MPPDTFVNFSHYTLAIPGPNISSMTHHRVQGLMNNPNILDIDSFMQSCLTENTLQSSTKPLPKTNYRIVKNRESARQYRARKAELLRTLQERVLKLKAIYNQLQIENAVLKAQLSMCSSSK